MIMEIRSKLAGLVMASAMVVLAACSSTKGTDDAAAKGGNMDSSNVSSQASSSADADAANKLQRVFYFDFDKATLNPDVRAGLDAQAARLRKNNVRIRLEGHADERGTREYNLALGERRAKAVANYLAIQGVDSGRIETVSYGEEKPVASGHDEASWSQNRRVELVDVR